jgi:hypothetical protein
MVKLKTVGFRGFRNFFYSSPCIYLWLLLEATSKINRSGKSLASFSLIAIFAIIIFAVPLLMGKEISPPLSVSALILVSVYVILSFELLHRTSIALLGATVIVSCLLLLGSIEAPASFDFVIDVIDFNTIGLLLGMMIIIAILSESGVFQWGRHKSHQDEWRKPLETDAYSMYLYCSRFYVHRQCHYNLVDDTSNSISI